MITTLTLAYLAAGVALLLWVNLARREFRTDTLHTVRPLWKDNPWSVIFGMATASVVFIVGWPLFLALTLTGSKRLR